MSLSPSKTSATELSVCIVTYERPDYLRRCLGSLISETQEISRIVVVDASARAMKLATEGLAPVTYVHAPELAGWMTRSRNAALLHTTGDIVAFLDDDVLVRRGWAVALRRTFLETGADAVAGRTCNGLDGEEVYDEPIGRVRDDGTLSDGFASDPGSRVLVHHGIGANMAFSRNVLAELGGFRDDYPGTALREDTDMFLRVGALGRTVIFDPEVAVDHRPAPHVRGKRFDTRYKLYGRRNHAVLLARHAGLSSPLLRRWVGRELVAITKVEGIRRKVQRMGVACLGLLWGAAAVVRSGATWRGARPQRGDELGRRISGHLGDNP